MAETEMRHVIDNQGQLSLQFGDMPPGQASWTADDIDAPDTEPVRDAPKGPGMVRDHRSSMSHELRTPLNAIIGFADLLHLGMVPAGSPKSQEFAGHIAASGRGLLKVVNQLLGVPEVEVAQNELHRHASEAEDLSPVCAPAHVHRHFGGLD